MRTCERWFGVSNGIVFARQTLLSEKSSENSGQRNKKDFLF
jgi:hypothetical protein